MKNYPYLVCECEGNIIGYAYGSKHRERAAYLYSVDVSVYISYDFHGFGIGKKLYLLLFDRLKEQGYNMAFSWITIPNEKSIGLHKSMGFKEVGTYHNFCTFKRR